MSDIIRKSQKNERLVVLPCPDCGGEITARDCGYTTFNPGVATCQSCKRKWELGWVENAWEAGEAWNREQPKVKRRDSLKQQLSELGEEDGESTT